jgi:hypothetical protein
MLMGTVVAPGSEGDIPRNIGGILASDGGLKLENVSGEANLSIGLGSFFSDSLRFIGP